MGEANEVYEELLVLSAKYYIIRHYTYIGQSNSFEEKCVRNSRFLNIEAFSRYTSVLSN